MKTLPSRAVGKNVSVSSYHYDNYAFKIKIKEYVIFMQYIRKLHFTRFAFIFAGFFWTSATVFKTVLGPRFATGGGNPKKGGVKILCNKIFAENCMTIQTFACNFK